MLAGLIASGLAVALIVEWLEAPRARKRNKKHRPIFTSGGISFREETLARGG